MTDGAEKPEGTDGARESNAPGSDTAVAAVDATDDVKSLKATVADLNAKQAETNRQLQTLTEQLRAKNAPAGGEDEELTDEEYAALEEFGTRGDPVSRAVKKLATRQQKFESAVLITEQLRDYPKEERAGIWKHFQENQHSFKSVVAAAEDLQSRKNKTEVERLKEDNERLAAELRKAAEHGAKVDPNVVRTSVRETPAGEPKKTIVKMTRAEFDRQQATFKGEGRYREAMAQQKALGEDRIQLAD